VPLALDASTPAAVRSATSTAAVTTASFTAPTGALLLAQYAGNDVGTGTIPRPAITDTGGLVWKPVHFVSRNNAAAGTQAMMWWAVTTSAAARSVTATNGMTADSHLRVAVITGAHNPFPIGASGFASSMGQSAGSVTYTTTAANSWGWMVASDWNAPAASPTMNGSTTQDSWTTISGQMTAWTARQTTQSLTAGTNVTIGATTPGIEGHFVYVEIIPAQVEGSWQYRRAITIDQTNVDADLTDFPVLVKLTSANFTFANAQANGNGLRFRAADGTTELVFERERHDSVAQLAEYWVRVPIVSGTVNTTINLDYGNPTALDHSDRWGGVWDNDYLGVYHLNNDSPAEVTWTHVGTSATLASGTTTAATTLPTGYTTTADDLALLFVGSGNSVGGAPTGPSGWFLIADGTGGAGTYGVGAGLRRVQVYGKRLVAGDVANPTITQTGNTPFVESAVMILRPSTTTNVSYEVVGTTGADNTDGTGFAATAATVLSTVAGDLMVGAIVCNDAVTNTSVAIGGTGTSTAYTVTERLDVGTTSGADGSLMLATATVAGHNTAANTMTSTLSLTSSGVAAFIHVRAIHNTWPDSTANNALIVGRGTTAATDIEGRSALAADLDGTDDYGLVSSNIASVKGLAAMTIEASVRPDVNGTGMVIYEEARGAGPGFLTRFKFQRTGANTFSIDGRTGDADAYANFVASTATTTVSTWYNVAARINTTSDSHTMYVNGTGVSASNARNSFANTEPGQYAKLGRRVDEWGEFFNGTVDEVRISRIARSDAWLVASHHSVNNSLLTVGTESALGGGNASINPAGITGAATLPAPVVTAFTFANIADGGTATATVTTGNSGGASGDPWTFVSIPTTGAVTFETGSAYRGALGYRVTAGTTAGGPYLERTLSSTGNTPLYLRMRARLDALPGTDCRLAVITDSGGAFQIDVRVTSAGALNLRSGAGVVLATTTGTYTAGQWIDFGAAILVHSTTVGQLELVRYDAAGAVAETLTSSANVDTLRAGGFQKLQVGIRTTLASFAVDLDDVHLRTSGYPVVPIAGGTSATVTTGAVVAGATTIGGAATSGATAAATALSGTSTVGAAASAAALAATSTVLVTATVGATATSASRATPGVVSGTVTVAASATSASRATPTALTQTVSIPVPAPSTAAQPTPTVVAATSTIGAPVGQAQTTALAAPTTVAATTTVGAAAASSTLAAPTVVVGSAAISASGQVGASASPAAVAVAATIGAVAPTAGALTSPGVIAAAATIAGPGVTGGNVPTAVTVVGVATIGTVRRIYSTPGTSLTIGGLTPGVTYRVEVRAVDSTGQRSDWSTHHDFTTPLSLPTPAVVSGSATVAAAATASSQAAPTALALTGTLAAPVVRAGAKPVPAVVAANATVGAPTPTAAARPAPGAVTGLVAIGDPTVRASSVATPAVLTRTVAIGVPAPAASALTSPATVTGNTTVSAFPSTSVVAAPTIVAATATISSPAVAAATANTATPPAVTATVTIGAAATTSALAGMSTVTGPATVGATASASALAAPAGVTRTVTIGGPLFTSAVAVAATTVTGSAGIAVPAAGGSAFPTAPPVTGAATFGAAAVRTGSLAAPAGLATLAAFSAPTVATGSRVSPVSVAGNATVGGSAFAPALAFPAGITRATVMSAPTVRISSAVLAGALALAAVVGPATIPLNIVEPGAPTVIGIGGTATVTGHATATTVTGIDGSAYVIGLPGTASHTGHGPSSAGVT
jgi:hypothetical protein